MQSTFWGGGTPCQSFSVAGKRAGLDDPRGNLTLEFLGLVGRLLPRWVVWENVPGVLSIDGGRTFGTFLWLLGQLGYGFAYRVLDAQFFGLAQRRRRVFVVGHRGDRTGRLSASVLFEWESVRGDSPPRREAGARPAATLASRATSGSSYAGRCQSEDDNVVAHSLRADGFDASEDGTGRGTPLVAYSLRRDADRDGEAKTPSADADGLVRLRDAGFSVYENIAPTVDHAPHSVATFQASDYREGAYEEADTARPLTTSADRSRSAPLALTPFDPTQLTSPENRSNPQPGDPSPTLPKDGHGVAIAEVHPILEPGRRSGRSTDDPRCGLGIGEAGDPMFTVQAERPHGIATSAAVRRLTPVECERLQGFPDCAHRAIILVCSTEQQQSRVRAAIQSLRSLRCASRVAADVYFNDANRAGESFLPSPLDHELPVVAYVRIDYEHSDLLLRSPGRSDWSASAAGASGSSPLRMPLGDFVRLAVPTLRCGVPLTTVGRVASPHSSDSFLPRVSGSEYALSSGREIDALASDAGQFTNAVNACLRFTTSQAGCDSPSFAEHWKIWSSCVSVAISSFIPEPIRRASSYAIVVDAVGGWTAITYRGKPAADGPRYRALGNAFPVPVLAWIGQRIALAEAILRETGAA